MQRYKVIIEIDANGGDHSQAIQKDIEQIGGFTVVSAWKEVDTAVKLGAVKNYLFNTSLIRTGQHWESGFAHGAFGFPCGGRLSEIEGYAAGKLWAEDYDREV